MNPTVMFNTTILDLKALLPPTERVVVRWTRTPMFPEPYINDLTVQHEITILGHREWYDMTIFDQLSRLTTLQLLNKHNAEFWASDRAYELLSEALAEQEVPS